jgi:hypothetical protein
MRLLDRDGAVAHQNANPLTLDALGSCVVWMESGKVYDWIAKDSLGNTIENTLGISGASSSTIAPSPWIVTGLTPTFVNTRTFTLVGNQTAEFQPRRRIRTTNTGGTKYATIISSVFSTLTTVVLGFQNNTDVLDAGLSAVDLGIAPADNPMDMVGTGSIIDLTGYSGADIALGIGQSTIYTVTAATSLLLRIATGDNQRYELTPMPDSIGTVGVNASAAVLQPNNANTGAGAVIYEAATAAEATAMTAVKNTANAFLIDGGGTPFSYITYVCTRTKSKTVISFSQGCSATQNLMTMVGSRWNDTTTAWTSLGTMAWVNAWTGLMQVTRKL